MMEKPFVAGDKVRSDYTVGEAHIKRTVVECYSPRFRCQSGWFVRTVDAMGNVLECDSDWFRKA